MIIQHNIQAINSYSLPVTESTVQAMTLLVLLFLRT